LQFSTPTANEVRVDVYAEHHMKKMFKVQSHLVRGRQVAIEEQSFILQVRGSWLIHRKRSSEACL
jgi:hypothetical protein